MSILTRGTRLAALGAAAVLGTATLAVTAPSAHAAETGQVDGGSLSWAFNELMNGRTGFPAPAGATYTAPAALDVATGASTWKLVDSDIETDGSAVLAFDGAAVLWAKTGNAWVEVADPTVSIDADGAGALTADVSYGTTQDGEWSTRARVWGRAGTKVLDLVADPAATAPTYPADYTASAFAFSVDSAAYRWSNLKGLWATDLVKALEGDDEDQDPSNDFIYKGSFANTIDGAQRVRFPLPFSITATRAIPSTSVKVVGFDKEYLDLSISGTGFMKRSGVQRFSDGIYVGVAPSGGILGVDAGGQADGMAQFAGSDHVGADSITDGAFTKALAVDTAKLVKGRAYSLYTWSAHGNPVAGDSQMTETRLSLDWNKAFPPAPAPAKKVKPSLAVKVTKVPTTRKAGKAAIVVKGNRGVATGKVKVQVLKGKKVVKNLGRKTLRKGKVVVALPKRPKGTYKVKVTYAGNAKYQAAAKAKAYKIRKR